VVLEHRLALPAIRPSIKGKFPGQIYFTNKPGKYFIKLYYKYSQTLAKFVKMHEYLHFTIRLVLAPDCVFFAPEIT